MLQAKWRVENPFQCQKKPNETANGMGPGGTSKVFHSAEEAILPGRFRPRGANWAESVKTAGMKPQLGEVSGGKRKNRKSGRKEATGICGKV